MTESLTTIVVALIGLLGTVLAAYLGYRQWRLSRRDLSSSSLVEKRRAAYETLWQRLNDLEVELRRSAIPSEQLGAQVAEINRCIMQNEIYVKDETRTLVNEYLKSVQRWTSHVRESGSDVQKSAMHDTAAIPTGFTELANAQVQREHLKAMIQKELRASEF